MEDKKQLQSDYDYFYECYQQAAPGSEERKEYYRILCDINKQLQPEKKEEKRDHNAEYAVAQDLYLNATSKWEKEKYLSQMYAIAKSFYRNYLCHYAKLRCLTFTPDQVNQIKHDCAVRTITHYLDNPDFKIQKLSSYGHFDFLKIITEPIKWDQLESLDKLKEDYDGNDHEINWEVIR